jgi:hypothetical protein
MKSPLRTEAGPLVYGKVNKREAAVLQFSKQVQAVTWDFSSDGGAVGDILFGVKVPAGAIVTGLCVDKESAVTGATSVVLNAGSTALSGTLNLATIGTTSCPALAGSATAIKIASASELKLVISTTAGTAGKVTFYVEYLEKA